MLTLKIDTIISQILDFENKLIHKKVDNIENQTYCLYNKLFDTSSYLIENLDSLLYNLNKILKSNKVSHNLKTSWLISFNYLINKKIIIQEKLLEKILALRFVIAWIYTKESFEYIETDIKLLDSIQKFKKIYFSNDLSFFTNKNMKEIILSNINKDDIFTKKYVENKFIWYLL